MDTVRARQRSAVRARRVDASSTRSGLQSDVRTSRFGKQPPLRKKGGEEERKEGTNGGKMKKTGPQKGPKFKGLWKQKEEGSKERTRNQGLRATARTAGTGRVAMATGITGRRSRETLGKISGQRSPGPKKADKPAGNEFALATTPNEIHQMSRDADGEQTTGIVRALIQFEKLIRRRLSFANELERVAERTQLLLNSPNGDGS